MSAPETNHGRLVDDLLRPAAYPPPAPRAVTLVTTHASWACLTEREVWKVKRPVDFGFLDYSDPERRRRCAEEEVRLGRRLAAEVYLGVVPVLWGPAGHTFVGPGEPVDVAVHMKRLPDDHSARALVGAGRLGAEHIRQLSERLATFYATTPRADAFGAPGRLAAQIEENYRQTLGYAGRFVERATLERLRARQLQQVEAAAPRLRRRVREGRIREGHGDLRLEHVYFPAGAAASAPIVIDPIDFNAGFRCQDTALDVAFLAMELEAEGRPDLGAYFLACHARACNDYELYALADLYLGYRAWVRAKVACLVAGDPATPGATASRKATEAARLFALADVFAARQQSSRVPTLFVVGGVIGSGKSTVADALGLALGAPVISSDGMRKALAGLAPTARGGPDLYGPRADARTYRAVLHAAEHVLGGGRDAVLDATFRQTRFRRDARAVAHRHGARFLFLAVDADDETLRERLRARAGDASISDAREDLLHWARRHYEPPVELAADELLPVDGRAPAAAIVAAVRARTGW